MSSIYAINNHPNLWYWLLALPGTSQLILTGNWINPGTRPSGMEVTNFLFGVSMCQLDICVCDVCDFVVSSSLVSLAETSSVSLQLFWRFKMNKLRVFSLPPANHALDEWEAEGHSSLWLGIRFRSWLILHWITLSIPLRRNFINSQAS